MKIKIVNPNVDVKFDFFFQSVQKKIIVNLIFGQFGQNLHQNMSKNLKFLVKENILGILWVKKDKKLIFTPPLQKSINGNFYDPKIIFGEKN